MTNDASYAVFDNWHMFTDLPVNCISIEAPSKDDIKIATFSERRLLHFGIREVHNEVCGGDPNTAPIAAHAYVEFDVNGYSKKLYKLDVPNNELIQVKVYGKELE